MIRTGRAALFVLALALWTGRAEALPFLQLDMEGGVYDSATQTIVAPGGPFTLYAVISPKTYWTPQQVADFLGATYKLSLALTPVVGPANVDLGSFTFGEAGSTPSTINATSDMTYGTPPLETFGYLQSADTDDLGAHEVYPTFFKEVEFKFSTANKAVAYDSAVTPGGPTPSASGSAYYAAFEGNTSNLAPGYELHFDLYHTMLALCGSADDPCRDVDVSLYAPFDHDAGTTHSVPEPATAAAALMGIFVGATGWRRRRGAAV